MLQLIYKGRFIGQNVLYSDSTKVSNRDKVQDKGLSVLYNTNRKDEYDCKGHNLINYSIHPCVRLLL